MESTTGESAARSARALTAHVHLTPMHAGPLSGADESGWGSGSHSVGALAGHTTLAGWRAMESSLTVRTIADGRCRSRSVPARCALRLLYCAQPLQDSLASRSVRRACACCVCSSVEYQISFSDQACCTSLLGDRQVQPALHGAQLILHCLNKCMCLVVFLRGTVRLVRCD